MFDTLEHFYFTKSNARGCAVRLQESWQAILKRREYPAPEQRLLGEMTAAAAMLSASITFPGSVLLQIMGDGPVRLAMVEVKPDLGLRAVVRLNEDMPVAENAGLRDLVNVSGKGRCAITLLQPDPAKRSESYQGIVDITEASSVAEAIAAYMSRLWLAADATAAGGLMLQKVAAEGGHDAPGAEAGEDWIRVQRLAETVTSRELLELEPRTLLTRLFWQENPRMAEPREPKFECGCSRERVAGMIRSLGKDDAEKLLKEKGAIEVTCEFCGKTYRFDSIDVHQLFEQRAAAGTGTIN